MVIGREGAVGGKGAREGAQNGIPEGTVAIAVQDEQVVGLSVVIGDGLERGHLAGKGDLSEERHSRWRERVQLEGGVGGDAECGGRVGGEEDGRSNGASGEDILD